MLINPNQSWEDRILDSNGRIWGPVERPSFKSHLYEIKSLKETETNLPHLEEEQRRNKPSTKRVEAARVPAEGHGQRDSSAG